MKRQLVLTRGFAREIEFLIAKKKISREDFNNFKKTLVENPKLGPVISSTGGIRKIRLKSVNKGKRGGFRVCYLDLEEQLILFLLFIYPKNDQEDLSSGEKKELKKLVEQLKKEVKDGKVI